ncbi:hypothetical protein H074_18698 [Amycolatopsis decaplanina DSM 44594]|uniref:DUF2267 domain-containing protein n=1 Tax=Amycolatopsis decaplanina DSM 44594 TaxID=1284240 RepID=M2YUS1_9PSEU|nr:hypothetical protein H074_18698 [Amycolatopsis decaplanina DSM 44594]
MASAPRTLLTPTDPQEPLLGTTHRTGWEVLVTHRTIPFAHAEQRAHEWLAAVAHSLGTEDRRYAFRVLRTWLHLVRDRLTVDSAVHFGAQLPELLRGIYYDGWTPRRVPMRYDNTWFTSRFADEAGIEPADVPATAGAVSAALGALCSPGQLEHVLALMPANLRGELQGEAHAPADRPRVAGEHARIDELEDKVRAISEAVGALARGLEQLPTSEPTTDHAAKAAQEAHRILLEHDAVEQ